MNVEVLFFGQFRELATRRQVLPLKDDARLVDLIKWLVKEYGDDFRKEISDAGRLHILINGQHCDLLDNTETVLKDSDVVAILPPATGG